MRYCFRKLFYQATPMFDFASTFPLIAYCGARQARSDCSDSSGVPLLHSHLSQAYAKGSHLRTPHEAFSTCFPEPGSLLSHLLTHALPLGAYLLAH